MKEILRGVIERFVPKVYARVSEDGALLFAPKGGREFCIDTGFDGGIAVPEKVLEQIDAVFVGRETFILATGEETDLPVFIGMAKVGDYEIETEFILGNALVGMEFMSKAASRLVLDLNRGEVWLER